MKNEPTKKMSLFEKLSYGGGNMGQCLITGFVTSFMMFFYTDIMKISVLQVGTIMMIGGVADAISDPLMGMIIDRTNSKWGKCRPYLLMGAIPFMIISGLLFHVPDASDSIRYIYALITYTLYTLAYTFIGIPQLTLLTNITDDQEDRLSVNMFGTLGTNFGQLVPSLLALTLVAALGGGSEESGYFKVAVIFGVAGGLLLLNCFKNTRERVTPPSGNGEKVSLSDSVKAFSNVPWLIVTGTTLLMIATLVIRASQTVYYCQFVLGDSGYTSSLLSISNIIGIPIALVVPFLASKIGKRNLVIISGIMGAGGCAMTYLFGSSFIVTMVFSVIIALSIGLTNGIIYVMAAETIDYGEWKHGKRTQGLLMSSIGFAVKIANSLCTMIASAVLSMGGYVGSSETQTAGAIRAIKINFAGLPMILFIIVIVINLFYSLDKKYPQILAEFEQRRAGQ